MERAIQGWKQFRNMAYTVDNVKLMGEAQLRQLIRSFVGGMLFQASLAADPQRYVEMLEVAQQVLAYDWQPGDEWK